LVKERTDGKVIIDVFPDGQLGGERETAEAVQMGTLEYVSVTSTILAGFVPEYLMFDLPFLFENDEAVYKFFDGKEGKDLLKVNEAKGMVGIGYLNNGFRVTTSNKPIKEPADVKGMSIRTMENPMHMATWKELGAHPTPLAFPELFTALQQGVIEAQENPVPVIATGRFHEVQDYISLTNHVNSMTVLVFNKNVWNNLPKEYQQIIKDAFAEAEAENKITKERMDQEHLKQISDDGCKIVKTEEINIAAFRQAIQPVYKMYEDTVDKDLLEFILGN
jgi:tripartite ATP-independent transporter DctP family solute receptor